MIPALTDSQISHFEKHGYVVAHDVLSVTRDIEPIQSEYMAVLDDLCQAWYAAGRLKSAYDDLPFDERLSAVVQDFGAGYYQYLDISLPQSDVSDETPIHVG